MSRYYSGPVSDHFDGERFFDPQGVPPRGRRDLLRWLIDRYWRGTRAKWPAWAPSPYADRPPPRVDGHRLPHFLCRACELSAPNRGPQHSARSGLVAARLAVSACRAETGERSRHRLCRLAADRCRSGLARALRSSRRRDAVAACRRSSPARYHAARQRYDHARARSRRSRPKLTTGTIASRSAATSAVTLVPTRHWSARNLSDRNMSLWASFVIEAPAGRIYFVGDSGYGDGGHFRDVRESATARSSSHFCRSAPTSRAGSWPTST